MSNQAHERATGTLIPAERLQGPRPQRTLSHEVDLRGLWADLRRSVEGEVRFDAPSRAMYAVDASNYRHVPIGVVIPKSRQDVIETVACCRRHGAPIVSRGGGTGLAGQTCNEAVVIDWSKYVNHVLEIRPYERLARVEPGLICDGLIQAVEPYQLIYGPAPATHNHCCFGGMIGNNSCGVHAQMAGKAVDNVEELEILLYDGTIMRAGWMDDEALTRAIGAGGRVGGIYAALKQLRDRYADRIRSGFPHLLRRVSGYNLDQLLPGADGRFNLGRALVGSEGTCVTLLEATVRLVHFPTRRVLLVVGYPDIFKAADHLTEILEAGPIGLESIDRILHDNIERIGGPHAALLTILPEGHGWLLVEFGADDEQEAESKARKLMDRLSRDTNPPSMKLVTDHADQHKLWEIRESALGATAVVPGEPYTWPGFEDSAVPPERMGRYLRDLERLFGKYGYNPSVYGHFGMGCVHCSIDFDLVSAKGLRDYRAFLEEAADLVVSHGGSLSGEHGDGQARAELLPKMFGPELMQAFKEFKAIWDPDGKMNPGRIVNAPPMTSSLRLGTDYHPWKPETNFRYPQDNGSFAQATLRCMGIGKCRRLNGSPDDDTMCPSFMVTREEKHSTRGRAHLLWEMLQKDPIRNGWHDEGVKDALDLCLSCKGCKGECPVQVDMATYKAEFLSHYWEGRVRPRHAYAFGLIDQWSRLASVAPGLVNLVTQLPGLRAVAKFAAGIPQERQIPAFAPQSFRSWFRTHQSPNPGAPRVVLWADTFNNYFFPDTAKAAVEVLEHAGYQVDVIDQHLCCGRPLYDYGMLGLAKSYLQRAVSTLAPHLEDGARVVVLEPSCASVFRDELGGLLPDHPEARKVADNTLVLSELLSQTRAWQAPRLERKALVQGHCHHKAVMRFDSERTVLDAIGLQWKQPAAGCCGMAGSFGFEKDKYPVSVAIGERVLLPEVRKASEDTLIVADGFSCREQIAQGTDRNALHLAEVLQLARQGVGTGSHPESSLVAQRKRAVRNSMIRAGAMALAALGGALAVGLFLRGKR